MRSVGEFIVFNPPNSAEISFWMLLSDGSEPDRGIPCVFLSGNCPNRGGHPLVIGCISKPFRAGTLGAAVHAAYVIAQGGRPGDTPAALRLYNDQ